MAGLEPANEGVKVPCLTAWLHPYWEERAGTKSHPSLFVGWVKGLEPSTPGTTIRCSNQLSYTHHKRIGAPEGIRTPDPRLRRPLLYPTELQAHCRKAVVEVWIRSESSLLTRIDFSTACVFCQAFSKNYFPCRQKTVFPVPTGTAGQAPAAPPGSGALSGFTAPPRAVPSPRRKQRCRS